MSDFKYEITEILGVGSNVEDLHTDWCIGVVKTLLNSDDEKISIINFNRTTNKPGKGIRLTQDECNNIVDILLQKGYGSLETLEKELEKRKSLYS